MAKAIIRIDGMHCGSCKRLIESVVSELVGVTACTVDPATGVMELAYTDTLDWVAFERAIAELKDYRITEKRVVDSQ